MPRPIQRENVDSVGDNFIMRPAPPQDDERRRSFYDTIDSENPVCKTLCTACFCDILVKAFFYYKYIKFDCY